MFASDTATVWHVAAARLLHGEFDEQKFLAWLWRIHGVDVMVTYPGVPLLMVAEMYRTGYARHVLTAILEHDLQTNWASAYRRATHILAEVAHG